MKPKEIKMVMKQVEREEEEVQSILDEMYEILFSETEKKFVKGLTTTSV